jgi:hypothetical protein
MARGKSIELHDEVEWNAATATGLPQQLQYMHRHYVHFHFVQLGWERAQMS